MPVSIRGPRPVPPHEPTEFVESWLHTPTEVERLFGLWAIKAGVTRTTARYAAGPRSIAYHSLHLVLDGAVEFIGEHDAAIPAQKGDLFCLFPQVSYVYRPMAGADPPRMLWLALDGPAAESLIRLLGLTRQRPCLRGLRIAPFLSHLPALRSVLLATPSRDTLAQEFLTRFLGELTTQVASLQAPVDRELSWVWRGKELIETHFDSAISVAEIADRVGVDRSHFSKMFCAKVGQPPSVYLRSVRMRAARELLRTTDLAVADIARSVGYGDVVAFSHAYRRHYRMSPTADRRSWPLTASTQER